ADQIASAVAHHRLNASVRSLAARLEAVQELAIRLNRTQELGDIADLIVEGTQRLTPHDSIRVYRVDHDARMCEPIAVKGVFDGAVPDWEILRVAMGEGLTGWAAERNETVNVGDATTDPRSLQRFTMHAPPSLRAGAI